MSAIAAGRARVPVPGLHDPVAFGDSHVVVAPPGRLVVVGGEYGSGPAAGDGSAGEDSGGEEG